MRVECTVIITKVREELEDWKHQCEKADDAAQNMRAEAAKLRDAIAALQAKLEAANIEVPE